MRLRTIPANQSVNLIISDYAMLFSMGTGEVKIPAVACTIEPLKAGTRSEIAVILSGSLQVQGNTFAYRLAPGDALAIPLGLIEELQAFQQQQAESKIVSLPARYAGRAVTGSLVGQG